MVVMAGMACVCTTFDMLPDTLLGAHSIYVANDRAGRRGNNVIVPVPPGTIVKTVERVL
jgi:hypothetical protein